MWALARECYAPSRRPERFGGSSLSFRCRGLVGHDLLRIQQRICGTEH